MDPLTMSLIAAGVGGLGQAAMTAMPTQQSRRNRRELDDLLRREETGALGLTGAEREAMERSQMDPVRTMATEARRAQEATAAGLAGPAGASAADLARIRRGEQQAVAEAARRAGEGIAQADLAEQQRERAEIEQRLGFQAARSADIMENIGATAADVAGLVGEHAGSPPTKLMGLFGQKVRDPARFRQQLAEFGFSSEDIGDLLALEEQYPGRLAQIALDSAFGGPMADPIMASILGDRLGSMPGE